LGLAAPEPDEMFRPDRILIKPAEGAMLAGLVEFHAATGARVLDQFEWLEDIQVLELPAAADVVEWVRLYRGSGWVEFAEPDYFLQPASVPDDAHYLSGDLWHLHNTGQNGGTAGADIGALEAWQTLTDAGDIVVAVVDTGVRYTHEDLAANLWINPGEIAGNGLDDDGSGYVDDIQVFQKNICAVLRADPWFRSKSKSVVRAPGFQNGFRSLALRRRVGISPPILGGAQVGAVGATAEHNECFHASCLLARNAQS
jgi:subtilisin family serine protease